MNSEIYIIRIYEVQYGHHFIFKNFKSDALDIQTMELWNFTEEAENFHILFCPIIESFSSINILADA